jgi:hypothetical protein
MGLGKTVQVLALLESRREEGRAGAGAGPGTGAGAGAGDDGQANLGAVRFWAALFKQMN